MRQVALKPRGIVEKGMSQAELLRYREGCKLRQQLARILPAAAVDRYSRLIGSFLGENFDEIIRFALISWLHDHAGTYESVSGRKARW